MHKGICEWAALLLRVFALLATVYTLAYLLLLCPHSRGFSYSVPDGCHRYAEVFFAPIHTLDHTLRTGDFARSR
jgi:hypothetical protein